MPKVEKLEPVKSSILRVIEADPFPEYPPAIFVTADGTIRVTNKHVQRQILPSGNPEFEVKCTDGSGHVMIHDLKSGDWIWMYDNTSAMYAYYSDF